MPTPSKYPLPSYLVGVVSSAVCQHWIIHHAKYLFSLDKIRKFPCAVNGSCRLYRDAIFEAMGRAGPSDPYTGDAMRWDLIGQYPHTKEGFDALDDAQRREFSFLPVVDHRDPCAKRLEFDICSWQINTSKCSSTPEEFVGLCKAVVDHCARFGSGERNPLQPLKNASKYNLPEYLQGLIPQEIYRRWLCARGAALVARDRRKKRPYANITDGGQVYAEHIHAAVCAGASEDPFTGRPLAWELIGTYDDFSSEAGGVAFLKKFALLPTVDHIDPSSDTLAFEICSYEINKCKYSLGPAEFVAQCKRIVEFRGK